MILDGPLRWFKRLLGRDEPESEVDGCFTLPGARLDDLADEPVGGPEDS